MLKPSRPQDVWVSSSMDAARDILRQHFGYRGFRPGQSDVVESVLAGRDTLAVLPTGGGKSICYQVPALMRHQMTLVVSPLISLMKDQVDRLNALGIAAAYLNSTLTTNEISERLARTVRGELKLLYVAPERLESEDLLRCLAGARVSLLAVDEAHCISEWGHDFRPSFRRIAGLARRIGRPQTIALTATATPDVRSDIVRQLEMRTPRIVVSGFDRTNLRYSVYACRNDGEKDRTLLRALKSHEQPSIVYTSTRSSVERIAKQAARAGIRALPYHAGLDDAHRHEVQEAFMTGAVPVIVATNAFGMGIDKADVRLVLHYAMPGTLEAYYQEAGRAGRDGRAADCVLLHARRDRLTHEWFIRGMYPERSDVERAFAHLVAGSTHGEVSHVPVGRAAESVFRLLLRERVLVPSSRNRKLYARLLATPARIQRELTREHHALELELIRAIWPNYLHVAAHTPIAIDLHELPPGIAGYTARELLHKLRLHQFIDFYEDDARYTIRSGSTRENLGIDWAALRKRRAADLAKLDVMQGYARANICRRAVVLQYFGESRVPKRCGRCDNCLRR